MHITQEAREMLADFLADDDESFVRIGRQSSGGG